METKEVVMDKPVGMSTTSPNVPNTGNVHEVKIGSSSEELNKFSAAELKELYNKERAKVPQADVVPPEKPLAEEKVDDKKVEQVQPETKIEAKQEEVKPPVDKKVEEVKQEVVTPEKIAEIVRNVIKESIPEEQPEPIKETPIMTDEEAQKMYEENPSKFILEINKRIKEDVKKELLESINKETAPVLGDIKIERHLKEAHAEYPELKDAAIVPELQKLSADPKVAKMMELDIKNGVNPYGRLVEKYRSNKYLELQKQTAEKIAEAKQQGIKEGEEKSVKSQKAFVEGSGKPQVEEGMTPEKFSKLSSEDMKKYLPRKNR